MLFSRLLPIAYAKAKRMYSMFDLSLVPLELHEFAKRALQRFDEALARDGVALPALPPGISPEEFSRQLTRTFIGSEYVAKTCAQHPQLLVELIHSGDLFRPLAEQGYPDFLTAATTCTTDAELDKVLRQHRHKAMVRIIWRDLNRAASMSETTAELSLFADMALQQTLAFHYRALVDIHGTPKGKTSGLAQPFMVLGMGKLGACELNVSSDIDLIFTFPEAGETDHAHKPVSNQEFFIKLGQRLIKSIDTQTADGFVFRVDMRLRPHGQSGALALNFDALEDYYQTQGRDWGRYAM